MARLSKDDKPIQQNLDVVLDELQGDVKTNAGSLQPRTVATPAKVSPVVTKESLFRAAPVLIAPPVTPNDTVMLVEKKTGARIPMARNYAERFVKKNPLTHYVS